MLLSIIVFVHCGFYVVMYNVGRSWKERRFISLCALSMNTPQYVILHHTAVSREKNNAQFNATNDYHKSKNFPLSSLGYYVGYHYMIEPDGRVVQARAEKDTGAHCYQQNMNYHSIAVCLTGNFDSELPTQAQIDAALKLVTRLQGSYKIADTHVVPHRFFAPKSCWGNNLPSDVMGYLRGNGTVNTTVQDTIPNWATNAFTAAEKFGYSKSNPSEEIGSVRQRQAYVKHPRYHGYIEDKDAKVTYAEYITMCFKAGDFN